MNWRSKKILERPEWSRQVRLLRDAILRMREELNRLLAKHSGQSLERIAADTERDFFMGSEAAKKYGIIDDIVSRKD